MFQSVFIDQSDCAIILNSLLSTANIKQGFITVLSWASALHFLFFYPPTLSTTPVPAPFPSDYGLHRVQVAGAATERLCADAFQAAFGQVFLSLVERTTLEYYSLRTIILLNYTCTCS